MSAAGRLAYDLKALNIRQEIIFRDLTDQAIDSEQHNSKLCVGWRVISCSDSSVVLALHPFRLCVYL